MKITEKQARYLAATFRMPCISGLLGADPANPVDPNTGQIDFVRTLRPDHPPGSAMVYKASDPWALQTAIEAVTGLPFAASLSRLVWSRTGALDDAQIVVDCKGSADTGGGAGTTAYDLALWALLYLNQGRNQRGEQVLSEEFVKDVFSSITRTGKLMLNDTATQFTPAKDFYQRAIKEDYLGYRSFLVSGPNGSVAASGMWGQIALMQPKVNTAIIKFGAYDSVGKTSAADSADRDIEILNDIAETLAKL